MANIPETTSEAITTLERYCKRRQEMFSRLTLDEMAAVLDHPQLLTYEEFKAIKHQIIHERTINTK